MSRPVTTQAELLRELTRLEKEAADAGLSFATALHAIWRRGHARAERELAKTEG